jgi:putative oxidoreductase
VPSRAGLGAFLLACTLTGAILAHLFILHTSPIAPLALLIVVGLVIWLRRDQIASWLGGTPRATGQGAA